MKTLLAAYQIKKRFNRTRGLSPVKAMRRCKQCRRCLVHHTGRQWFCDEACQSAYFRRLPKTQEHRHV